VVNALKGSPWGAFTIIATMPIAIFHGTLPTILAARQSAGVLRARIRAGGRQYLGGQAVSQSATMAPWFTYSGVAIAAALIVYGFLASALPVWLLLAPRDYLSTFVKLGVVLMLGVGILLVRPELQMPALTRFVDGTGPIFAGKVFPFCFITVACGRNFRIPRADFLGNHAEAAGEGAGRPGNRLWIDAVGEFRGDHGAGCRLRASARRLFRGVNSPAGVVGRRRLRQRRPSPAGDSRDPPNRCARSRRTVGEQTLFYRTGGGRRWRWGWRTSSRLEEASRRLLAFWYHFAIMFEALFIPDHHGCRNTCWTVHAARSAGANLAQGGPHELAAGKCSGPARAVVAAWDFSCIRGCAIHWAASIRCGRCSESRISCWRRLLCASPPLCW